MRLVLRALHLKFRDDKGNESEYIRFHSHQFTDILPVGTTMWVPKFDSQDGGDGNHVKVKLVDYEVNFGADGSNPVTEAILATESKEDTDRVVIIKEPWELRNSPID